MKAPEQHHRNIDELIDNMRPSIHEMLDRAAASGAFTEEELSESTFVIAKAVITVWGRQEPYAPLHKSGKKMVKNLSLII